MTKTKKSWQEKLAHNKGLPKVIDIPPRMQKRWGHGQLVIPTPLEVDQVMKKVPKGKLITLQEIRSLLAKKYKVELACPVTVGIFIWIASHAAEEMMSEGKTNITPYWRTLKTGGLLNPKYPGGIHAQTEHLKAEGHVIENDKNKKSFQVKNFEKYLFKN